MKERKKEAHLWKRRHFYYFHRCGPQHLVCRRWEQLTNRRISWPVKSKNTIIILIEPHNSGIYCCRLVVQLFVFAKAKRKNTGKKKRKRLQILSPKTLTAFRNRLTDTHTHDSSSFVDLLRGRFHCAPISRIASPVFALVSSRISDHGNRQELL